VLSLKDETATSYAYVGLYCLSS